MSNELKFKQAVFTSGMFDLYKRYVVLLVALIIHEIIQRNKDTQGKADQRTSSGS